MAEVNDVVAELRAAVVVPSTREVILRAADLLAHQAARLEEVTRERDEQAQLVVNSMIYEARCDEAVRASEAALASAEAQKERYRAAIEWALGEGDSDFGDNKPENAKPFWWRTELRQRAALSPKKEQTDV
jgi:hypothetical protein